MLNKGIYPALITPFDSQGKVDHLQLRKLVRHLLNDRVDGFYVCGTTGESFLMDASERMSVLETVVDENDGRASVVCHCGNISTEHTLNLARHARKIGVDAVSAIPPFYYKFSSDELIAHYKALAQVAELPVIIYNFPALSGVQFTAEMWDELLAIPNVRAVKHTSFDLYQLERIKKRYPKILLFHGHEEMMLAGLTAGADGSIGSTFNAVPRAAVAIREHFLSGNLQKAKECQCFLNDFIDLLHRYGTMQVIKRFLANYDITSCYVRAPFMQISEEGIRSVDCIVERYRSLFG